LSQLFVAGPLIEKPPES